MIRKWNDAHKWNPVQLRETQDKKLPNNNNKITILARRTAITVITRPCCLFYSECQHKLFLIFKLHPARPGSIRVLSRWPTNRPVTGREGERSELDGQKMQAHCNGIQQNTTATYHFWDCDCERTVQSEWPRNHKIDAIIMMTNEERSIDRWYGEDVMIIWCSKVIDWMAGLSVEPITTTFIIIRIIINIITIIIIISIIMCVTHSKNPYPEKQYDCVKRIVWLVTEFWEQIIS